MQGPRSIFAIGGGGRNEMPKAFLAHAAGASVLGVRGHASPENFYMLLEWLKIHPIIADPENSFIIYHANKHQI